MAAARADAATYRNVLEISELIKKPEVKKDFINERNVLIMLHRRQIKKSLQTFSCLSPDSSSYSNKSGKDLKKSI